MGKFTQSVIAVSLEPKVEPIKLVEKGTVNILSTDTSTTETKIKECSFTVRDNCLYYYVCRKSQTPDNGLFSNENLTEGYYQTTSTVNITGATTGVKTVISNGLPTKGTTSNIGIFAKVYNGKMCIYKKYNSSSAPNWSGVYNYKIYEIDLSKLGE